MRNIHVHLVQIWPSSWFWNNLWKVVIKSHLFHFAMFGQILPSFEGHVRPLWATPVWYPCCATLFCLMSIDFSVIIPFVWLNPWAGKMKWIVCCYLRLLEGQDGPIWTTRSFLHWSNKKEFPFWPYNKSFIDQANVCSRWLDVGLVLFSIFTDLNLSRFFLRGGGHMYTG